MDKLVIDIETKNAFADVGGQQFLKNLDMSFLGAYSYNEDKYLSFFEDDFSKLSEFFSKAGLIIGFASNRFDIPILSKYVNLDLLAVPRIDILDEIEMASGRRVGLDLLVQINLGMKKTAHGLKAIEFYRNGQFKELEEYCLQDVRVTKELYDLVRKQGYVLVPDRFSGENERVQLDFDEGEMVSKQSLF